MKFFIYFCLLTLSLNCFAGEFKLSSVSVNCLQENCDDLRESFKSLKRRYSDYEHFHKIMKIYVSNEGVRNLNYKLFKSPENVFSLEIQASQKKRILYISDPFFISDDSIDFPSIIPLKVDDFLDVRKLEQTEELLKEISADKGYPDAQVITKVIERPSGVDVEINVDLGKPIIVTKINIFSKSLYLKNVLSSIIGEFKNRTFDVQTLKSEIERTRKLFLQYGYYLSEIDLKIKKENRYQVQLFVTIRNVSNYTFFVRGLENIGLEEIKSFLSTTLVGFKREMTEESVAQALGEKIEKYGYKNFTVKVKTKNVIDVNKERALHYYVDIKEGKLANIESLVFKGNGFYSDKELEAFFYTNGSDMVVDRIHDLNYYYHFLELLREKYIQDGFVSVFIEKPFLAYDKTSGGVNITYRLREGVRTQVSSLNILGLSAELSDDIKTALANKTNNFFNPIEFENDLNFIKSYLRARGYFFTKIKNLNSTNLVHYSEDHTSVDLTIDIYAGYKMYTDEIIIIGNKKTRKLLIKRELGFKPGDLITSDKIEQAQTALLSLGIFNQVQIQPVRTNKANTDVLVFVREKDFGLVELAPGIRSDLGFKLSTTLNYNNIDGMNKKISFKGSVNSRLNLNSLDDERRKDGTKLLEYNSAINYSESHLFHSEYEFRASVAKIRKRFYSFDADIQRLSFSLSKEYNAWFSSNLKYQLETISQFNATETTDGLDTNHGHFQIGSITPSFSFDFRDRKINARKGAFFGLSLEVANPSFLSQSDDDLVVDYYKFISRNKFYVPFGRDVVLAMSTSFGLQQNNARDLNSAGEVEGYIPSLKVFRLSGADIVRGYEDSEINTVSGTNEDITSSRIENRAYMVNLKIEPRLFLSDTTVFGVFYDAGRVFVDEFDSSDLRSSVGVTFKYLTPVGSLDFDYGIKLLRKKDSDGKLDSPGRLHVSIGFF